MTNDVPVLTTARLQLRRHRASDLASCYAMWSDPNVTRFIGGIPSTEQQTWSRIMAYVGHWELMGFGYWLLEDRTSGAFVGEAGFADFKRDIIPAMRTDPELGFALASAYHGRGYATEAVEAILRWGDEHLPSRRTVCMIVPENSASLNVARKCGYTIFAEDASSSGGRLFLERRSSGG